MDKTEPSKPKQWWNKYSFLIAIIGFIIGSFSLTQLTKIERVNIKETYRNEINQLLDSGITKENQNKALELLLKYSIEYKTEEQPTIKTTNRNASRIFLTSLILILISIFRPKTTVGIGANRNVVRFYKVYSYFILVTIPGIFILPPLIDWIRSLW